MGFNTTNKNGSKTLWGECNCTELRCIHWNNWDMADIPRITITDEMTDKERDAFERYNQSCEETELLWIELEIQRMEQEEKKPRKQRSDKGKRRRSRSYIGAEVMEEIYNPSPDTLMDTQGATEIVRYDDEYDYDDSHR